jgi:hypothetical protein
VKIIPYFNALVDQWERGLLVADDVVREVRRTLQEEAEIAEAEIAEAVGPPAVDPQGGYIIVSNFEDDEDGVLYWSNDDGWGHRSTATVFPDDRTSIGFPMEAAGWVKVSEAFHEVMEARTFLVHLNVEVPRDDTRSEQELVEAIEGALTVGWDDDSVRGLNVCVALTERI